MIEIPEEGLRIWICGRGGNTFEDMQVNPKECYRGKRKLCPEDGKPCDAQAYRIVREKP